MSTAPASATCPGAEEIQRANMLDMANVGALIRSSEQLIEELER